MSNLELVIREIDGVEFYSDAVTGQSGISQSGLAVLCGVSRQAVSKLIKSLSSKANSQWLEPLQSEIWKTQTGMVLISESSALDIIRYYYKQGKCTEVGCKAIGMPIFTPKKQSVKGTEVLIRDRLQQKLGGSVEVPTVAGRIDLLTSTEIIEIKEVKSWKSGLGQLLVYGSYYPSHTKRYTYLEIVTSRLCLSSKSTVIA